MQNIRIIEHKDIDFNKWDALVDKYSNGLPYANTWYLDAVCDQWKVIIYKDYEAGFAFQIKRKYGLAYSLHPFLVQQLGFLGSDDSIFKLFLAEIEKKVFHYQYQLNAFNRIDTNVIQEKSNYELLLDKSYEDHQKQYKTNAKRNIKKSYNQGISVTKEASFRPTDMDFVLNNSKINLDSNRLNKFKQLMANAEANSTLEIYRAEKDNELLSMIVFIKNKVRSIYLMAISSSKGQELKANFLLVDSFIKDKAESSIILDFEGSSIEGIARFYAGFGAQATTYKVIKNTTFRNFLGKIL